MPSHQKSHILLSGDLEDLEDFLISSLCLQSSAETPAPPTQEICLCTLAPIPAIVSVMYSMTHRIQKFSLTAALLSAGKNTASASRKVPLSSPALMAVIGSYCFEGWSTWAGRLSLISCSVQIFQLHPDEVLWERVGGWEQALFGANVPLVILYHHASPH